MKKQIITLLFTSLLLVGCGSSSGDTSVSESSSSQAISEQLSESSSEEVKQIANLTASGYEVRHTDIQLNYLNSENYNNTDPYSGNLSKSAPNPVHFSWESEKASNFTVHLYEGNNIDNEVASYKTSEKELDFYNTKLGQEYTVVVSDDDNLELPSEKIHFTTDSRGPRNLFIEGVENVRDLASWGNIKQGMIYRSGRFNEDSKEEVTVSVTDNGIYELNNVLKIKTEIDLRRTSTNEVGGLTDTSVLGEQVNYIQLPMAFGGNNILTFKGTLRNDECEYDNPKEIKNFFEILADESNYPIDFHCSIGKDRTGCMAYLIEGLLGVSEENLMRDYMFTNFSNAGFCKYTDVTTRYGKTLSDYENGDTLQDKIYNYLNEVVEISKDTLDSVINILKAE